MSVATLPYEYETGTFRRYLIAFEKYIQYHTLEIFWLSMYAGINTGIFLYYFCEYGMCTRIDYTVHNSRISRKKNCDSFSASTVH